MKIQVRIILLFLLVSFQAQAQLLSSKAVNIAINPIQEISLNGNWSFIPANGIYNPINKESDFVDKKADEIYKNKSVSAFQISVPQFLNRVSWWLPHVSDEFENQETARIKA